MKLKITPILFFILFVSLHCRLKDNHVPLDEAYSEINTAIMARAQRCGQEPAYPLILPGQLPEYGLRLCSLLILQGECPFHDFPLPCIEIYSDDCKACDLPGFDP